MSTSASSLMVVTYKFCWLKLETEEALFFSSDMITACGHASTDGKH